MNYEDMSDSEINRRLTELIHNPSEPHCIVHNGVWHKSIGHIIGDIPTGSFKFLNDDRWWAPFPDYCNNPSDAWTIIVDNEITIRPDIYIGRWYGQKDIDYGMECDSIHVTRDENPLRAAMICFLKMKDAESD